MIRHYPCMEIPNHTVPVGPERIEQNLRAWADITSLCIDLRKSVLRAKLGVDDDSELVRLVFRESVLAKEKKWTATES